MTKVLRHGCAQYSIDCTCCNCLFLFEDEDVKRGLSDSKWVFCPECGHAIDIHNLSALRYRKEINPRHEEIKDND